MLSRSVTFWLLASQVLTAGVAFLLNLLSSTALPPEERGYLALFLQLGYLATTLALLGVERPYVAAYSTGFARATRQLCRLVLPGLTVAAVALLAGGAITIASDPQLGALLLLGAMFVVTNIHLRVLRSAYISSKSWRPYVAAVILSQGLLLSGAVGLALARVDVLYAWILAYVVAGTVPSITVLLQQRSRQALDFTCTDEFRQIRRRGLLLVPASLGNTAMLRSDRLLLPLLASPAALGIYAFAATAIELASWPVQQWCDSRLRSWAEGAQRGWTALVRPLLLAMGVTLVISICMAAIVWLTTDLFLSTAYQPAKDLLMPLVLAAVVYAATRVQQAMMIASGWTGNVSVAETTGMAASVVGYVLFIPLWGPLGAAWASLAGYLICFAAGAVAWINKSRS